jgi:23S rRNA (guanosine2251-2'-O)-methyltransferase
VRRICRLETTEGADRPLETRADHPPIEHLAREAFERLLPRGAVHQGLAVQTEDLQTIDLDDLLRNLEGRERVRIVVLDQVTDPHNVGAVLRSAAAFGAAAIVMPERNAPPTTGALAKAASGALERVPLIRVVNLARALDQMKDAAIWCVALDADASETLDRTDLTGRVAIVLGAEGEGLRRLTRDRCDLAVRVPIDAASGSLNVSNAAAIALYELQRRS